jgi:superfamily II DNA or RNA helicase
MYIINMYISKHGYVIKKEEISKEELKSLKKELIAKPIEDKNYVNYNSTTNYPIYIETQNKIYIPKMFGLKRYKNNEKKEMDDYIGKNINVNFKGELRIEQQEVFRIMVEKLKEKKGGILQASAGCGKTVICLKIITELKKKALIIVNKISLLNQWVEEIKRFIPDAKIGIIQGNKCDTKDKDIIVGMLHSLSRKDYPKEKFDDIGMVCIDEIHHMGAKVFSQVFFKVTSYYTLGLSATPQRADALEYVFKWHIGDVECKKVIESKGKEPVIKILKLNLKRDEYKEIKKVDYKGKEVIMYTSMLSDLINMNERNEIIIKIIKEKIREKGETEVRKILVLSDRREHLEKLREMYETQKEEEEYTSDLFLGGMKSAKLENAKKARIIFATYKAFGEGVDEKDLNTLILTTPKKYISKIEVNKKRDNGSLEQIVRRIIRKDHKELNPEIIDLNDDFSVYKTQSNSRKVFYKKHFEKYILKNENIEI